jgi:hypothetical protein
MATYSKKGMTLLAVPSIDFDFTQSFPLCIPTVIFEIRLFNPRIGGFAGYLKRDVVTTQGIDKFDVQLQGASVRPEDIRY